MKVKDFLYHVIYQKKRMTEELKVITETLEVITEELGVSI
jgi:hypothetical protein